MTIIETIRAEIVRLMDEYKPIVGGVDELTGAHIVLAKLLSSLSTLESEKPVPNDLEEAAKECNSNLQLQEYFIKGGMWQKEQMMKEAVDATVHLEPGANPVIEIGVGRFGLNVRDKVKVIIVKEEEK